MIKVYKGSKIIYQDAPNNIISTLVLDLGAVSYPEFQATWSVVNGSLICNTTIAGSHKCIVYWLYL